MVFSCPWLWTLILGLIPNGVWSISNTHPKLVQTSLVKPQKNWGFAGTGYYNSVTTNTNNTHNSVFFWGNSRNCNLKPCVWVGSCFCGLAHDLLSISFFFDIFARQLCFTLWSHNSDKFCKQKLSTISRLFGIKPFYFSFQENKTKDKTFHPNSEVSLPVPLLSHCIYTWYKSFQRKSMYSCQKI